MIPDRAVPRIATERLVWTVPASDRAPRLLDYVERNRDHLAPWEPTRPSEHYTVAYWEEELRRARDEFFAGRSMRLVAFPCGDDDGDVIAIANFTAFIRGAFQACLLGYSIDGDQQGRGLMAEGLEAAIQYAFSELSLHRVMANYQPHNARSARLLARLGFVVEGFARDYLYINGAWRDHVLTARANPTWQPIRR